MPVVLLPSVLVAQLLPAGQLLPAAQLLPAGQLLVLLVPLLVSLMLPLPPATQPLLHSAILLQSAMQLQLEMLFLLRSAMLHPPLLLLLWAEA